MSSDRPILSLLVPLHPSLPVEIVCDVSRHAQACGFGGLWYGDERFERDPFVVLARVAKKTDSILLGPAVCDPYTRHPAMTAASIATLDEISGNRARLGLGAGAAGFDLLGLAQPEPARSVHDAVVAIRTLLRGEAATVEGPAFRVRSGRMRFEGRDDIPILVAAEGPRMIEVAHRAADGVILAHTTTPADFGPRLERAAGSQRDLPGRPWLVLRLDATVSRDAEAAFDLARTRVGRVLWSQYPRIRYVELMGLSIPADLDRALMEAGPFQRTHDLSAFRRFAHLIPAELVEPVSLFGSVADVARQMQALLSAGVDEMMIHPLIAPGETLESALQMIGDAFRIAQNTLSQS